MDYKITLLIDRRDLIHLFADVDDMRAWMWSSADDKRLASMVAMANVPVVNPGTYIMQNCHTRTDLQVFVYYNTYDAPRLHKPTGFIYTGWCLLRSYSA